MGNNSMFLSTCPRPSESTISKLVKHPVPLQIMFIVNFITRRPRDVCKKKEQMTFMNVLVTRSAVNGLFDINYFCLFLFTFVLLCRSVECQWNLDQLAKLLDEASLTRTRFQKSPSLMRNKKIRWNLLNENAGLELDILLGQLHIDSNVLSINTNINTKQPTRSKRICHNGRKAWNFTFFRVVPLSILLDSFSCSGLILCRLVSRVLVGVVVFVMFQLLRILVYECMLLGGGGMLH